MTSQIRKETTPLTAPRWLHPAASAAVFLVVLILYWPSSSAEFVWDDLQITADDYVHDPANWKDVLTLRVLGRDVIDNNRPAMLLTLMIDAALWGKSARGYRLTNVLLHAANAALLCLLAARILAARAGQPRANAFSGVWIVFASAAGALLFAAHPANVEAVCVAAFREDPQATFFCLAALFVAARLETRRAASGHEQEAHVARAAGRFGIAAAALALVLLAIATKESAIVAPFAILAYWLGVRARRPGARTGKEQGRRPPAAPVRLDAVWIAVVGGAFLVVGLFLAARFILPPRPSDVYVFAPQRPSETLLGLIPVQSRIYAFLLQHAAWPTGLSAAYTPLSYAHIPAGVGIVVSLAVLAVLALAARRDRLALLGAVFAIGGLAAVGNVVPIFNPVADRYLYMPLAGCAWIAAAGLSRAGGFAPLRTAAVGLAVVALVALGTLTVARERVFRDDLSLWSDAARKTPDSPTPYNFMGWAYYERGEFRLALRSFETAQERARGGDPDSWAGAALTCLALDRADDAEKAYRLAVALQPRFRDPRLFPRIYFWKKEYVERLAVVGRRAGLWVEKAARD